MCVCVCVCVCSSSQVCLSADWQSVKSIVLKTNYMRIVACESGSRVVLLCVCVCVCGGGGQDGVKQGDRGLRQ